MKKFLNILLKILAGLTALILALVIITISSSSQRIPQVSVLTTSSEIEALMGNYTWNSFSEVLTENEITKEDYLYKSENTLLVSPNEKITIKNIENVGTNHYFEQEDFIYADSDYNTYQVNSNIISDSYKPVTSIEFSAPQKEGTYYYYLKLSYKEKGEVEYSFKVVVSSEPTYNVLELVKYKNTGMTDDTSIKEILNILPYSRNINNIAIKTQNYPTEIDVYYDEILTSRSNYNNNAIALFTLIPEIQVVSFYAKNANYVFSRTELERIQGRDLLDYVDDPELWEQEIMFKEKKSNYEDSKHEAYFKIIMDLLDLSSGDKVDSIVVDTNSFEEYSELGISRISKSKLIDELKDYSSIVYDLSINNHSFIKSNSIYIGAETTLTSLNESESGDTVEPKEENQFLVNILLIKNSRLSNTFYDIKYENENWIVSKHNAK